MITLDPAEVERGRLDFEAGRRDARTYDDADKGPSYRHGWRCASVDARDRGESPEVMRVDHVAPSSTYTKDDDRLAGFEHAGQTPISVAKADEVLDDMLALMRNERPPEPPVPPGEVFPLPLDLPPAPEPREQAPTPQTTPSPFQLMVDRIAYVKDAIAPPFVFRPLGTTPKQPYRVPLMTEIARIERNGYKAISTFSGCGGSSLGYKMAGFEMLWASEFIPEAQNTYRANHPGTILDPRDIRDVKVEDILAATGCAPGEIDLFDGSPPCASFSTAGIREEGWGRVKKYSDTKQRTDDLFFEFARLVKGVQAKVFVAENVAGLTVGVAKEQMLGEGQLDMFETQEDTILHTLMDCGYRVGFHVLNAENLGVPQARRRVIFVGIRKDLAAKFDLEPKWPQSFGYGYTIKEALEAPIPKEFDVPGVDISRYAIGAEWEKLKPGEQSERYFSLVKVHPNEVCPTVCASHGSGSIASITHWSEKRKFSIGELRRLSGFPDDFKLTGDYEQQWERLGRAVPPLMMAAIAATVRDEILRKILP